MYDSHVYHQIRKLQLQISTLKDLQQAVGGQTVSSCASYYNISFITVLTVSDVQDCHQRLS